MGNEKTLKERIEEYVSLSGFAAVVSAVPLLNECLAALTAPVWGELEEEARAFENKAKEWPEAHSVHQDWARTARILRTAGRRIAELEKDRALCDLAADRAASDRRIAELERELAAAKAWLAGDSPAVDRVIVERDQALERAKAAEKEARFHADGWAAANERAKAENAFYRASGRFALEWKREAEEQTAKRHDAEKRAERAEHDVKAWMAKANITTRIEGRTHEQTHARLVDAMKAQAKAEENARELTSINDTLLAKLNRASDPAFEARKRDAVKHLDSLPGRYRMPGYDAMVTLSIKQLLESLTPPAAPAKRADSPMSEKKARYAASEVSLDEVYAQLGPDLLDGGEG